MKSAVICFGAGAWGRNLLRNYDALGALGGICETSPEALAAIAGLYPDVPRYGSVAEAFRQDISAVVIATPAETHGDLVRRALEADKDVFVEKPLCLSVAEAEALVVLAERRQRILMVGHLLWYHPAVLTLRDLIASGELGRIQYIYSNRLNLGRIRREENALWSFAPHDISVILGLVGEEPTQVSAQGGNYLHERIADVTVSLLSFPTGVRAHVFVSWLHPFKEQKLVVVGDRNMAVFDDVEPRDKLVLYPHSIEWRNGTPVPNRSKGRPVALPEGEPLRAECEHFLECVRGRSRPRTDGHEAVRVLRVLRACQESLDGDLSERGSRRENGGVATSTSADTTVRVHESAYVDDGVELGEGSVVWHFSHLMSGSRIGRDCRIGQNVVIGPRATIGDGVKIQNNVSVYEGVTLEDHVFCGPSVVFTNVYNPRSEIRRMDELRPTLIRRGASLGANCTVVCGVTVGQYAFVGAGAVVHRDVPDYALVVGNPARVVGWVCSCGNRIDFDKEEGKCRDCLRPYRLSGERAVATEPERAILVL